MLISTVTLSRNQGKYLSESIDSILTQEFREGYFVYDVGSTDNSRELISNYQNLIEPILVDSDNGPSDGLNYCFERCRGDLFYYLNSDDRVDADAFAYVRNYFQSNPDCDVLHGSIRIIDRDGEVVGIRPSMKFSLLGYAFGYSVVYQQATFFRKEIFDRTGFNLENQTCWDGELIVDMAIAGANIHQTSKILGEFRIYPESITGSGRFREQIRSDHARIAHKILGRELRKSDIFLGLVIGKFKAILRRIFVMRQV